jgi:hypothetical protein
LKEILPIAFALGQKTPGQEPKNNGGTAALLQRQDLKPFFKAAFHSMLVPQLSDPSHQGLMTPHSSQEEAPFFLLRKAFDWIRSLLIQQQGTQVTLLPETPLFASGRMIRLQLPKIGELDFEWASFRLTRAILRPSFAREIRLILPAGIHSFRVRDALHAKGTKHLATEPLALEKGKTLYLDRFYVGQMFRNISNQV